MNRWLRSMRSGLRVSMLVVVIPLLLAGTAFGQGSSDGSIYSRLGIGERLNYASSQLQGMGVQGVGLYSVEYLSLSNPAAWSDQFLTRLSAGVKLQNISAQEAGGTTSRLFAGSLNGVSFSFPLFDQKLGFAVGFLPYSRVNYLVREQGELEELYSSDPTVYQINYEGRGGLQQIVGGLGYRIADAVSIGVSIEGVFGIQEDGQRTTFTDGSYSETNVTYATRLSGVTSTSGLLFTVRNILNENDIFSFGLTYTLPTSLNGRRVLTLGESLDKDSLGTTLEGDVELPWRGAAGFAYRPNPRWTVIADVFYEPWTTFESDIVFAGFESASENRMRDRLRIGAGVEYIPAGRNFLASYFSRVAYRLGFYRDQSYVNPNPETSVNTLALVGGLSLPTLFAGTRIDINIEAGTRGTTDFNLVRDRFITFTASLNVGERWFERTKLR